MGDAPIFALCNHDTTAALVAEQDQVVFALRTRFLCPSCQRKSTRRRCGDGASRAWSGGRRNSFRLLCLYAMHKNKMIKTSILKLVSMDTKTSLTLAIALGTSAARLRPLALSRPAVTVRETPLQACCCIRTREQSSTLGLLHRYFLFGERVYACAPHASVHRHYVLLQDCSL